MSRFPRLPFRLWWAVRPSRLPRPVGRRWAPVWVGLHRDLPIFGHTNPNVVQTAFRFRNDDGSETAATWKAAENTNVASQATGTNFRVRLEVVENAGGTGSAGGQLQVSLNGGTFQSVTSSSTVVKAVTSANVTDGTATTNQLTTATQTFTAGTVSTDGLATAVSLTSQQTEFEYVVQIVDGDVANADTIDFRVSGLNSYSQTGRVTVTKTVPPPSVVVWHQDR